MKSIAKRVRKNPRQVEIHEPDWYEKAFCKISITDNGYQWTSVKIDNRKQAERLYKKLGEYLGK